VAKLQAMMGEAEKSTGVVGKYGGAYDQIMRAPTGIFPLDLACGGGLPRGRMTEIYGPESSGKTNILLRTIAMNQELHPEQANAFIDMEGTWDPKWAKQMGVKPDDVYVVRPDFAEQAGDFVDKALMADDIGIVGVDSIGALGTERDLDKDMESFDPGGVARVVGKIVRKATRRLKTVRDQKKQSEPTLILLNQIRHKIGVMMGNPETTPGGFAPRFAYSMRIRTYAKNKSEKSINAVLPYCKDTAIKIVKWKCPITAEVAEYEMYMLGANGFKPGDVDDWNLIEKLLRERGMLEKGKKGWTMCDEEFPTLKACEARYWADLSWRLELQARFIQEAVKATSYDPEGEVKIDPKTGEILIAA